MRDNKMVKWEIFHALNIPEGIPFFVRLDGDNFSRICDKLHAEEPFDERIARAIVNAVLSLPKVGFVPHMGYLASDEINLLFYKGVPYGGRIEKILSVLSGYISSEVALNFLEYFGIRTGVSFDARVLLIPKSEMTRYIISRQKTLWNNCLVSYAVTVLKKKGFNAAEISERMKGLSQSELHEIILKEGKLNPSTLPNWQKNGILIMRDSKGYSVIWDAPVFTTEEGEHLLSRIIAE
ncbi:MAG: tRNA(His) guanylyltransferase Thg1 family protein [Candidatus Korarchaeota archaeon]